MGFKLVQRDKYVKMEDLHDLSPDQKEFLLLIEEKMKECSHRDYSFCPEIFRTGKDDSIVASEIEIDLYYGDFTISVYFYDGDYHSWSFSDNISKTRSDDRNKSNKERAKEKITYILEQYKL